MASVDAWGTVTFTTAVGIVDSTPPRTKIGSQEVEALSFDFAGKVADDDTLASATVILTDMTTGTAYSTGLIGAVSFAGTVVTQEVGTLLANRWYLLQVTIVTTAGYQFEQGLTITCPY